MSTVKDFYNYYENKFMHLRMYVEDEELKQEYKKTIEQHNKKLMENEYLDAGFDLLVPNGFDLNLKTEKLTKIDFKVKCSGILYKGKKTNNKNPTPIPTGYYLYPRSSLSKTPLRLANSVGIIDSGYRGNIMGMFDVLNTNDSTITFQQFTRLVQICAPGLIPIYVELVENLNDLGVTERGEGGFGSTGK